MIIDEQRRFGMGSTLDNLLILGLIETAEIMSYYIDSEVDRVKYLWLANMIKTLRFSKA